jgi:hypothetical protein
VQDYDHDDYHKDRETRTETLVEVRAAMERLAGRVDMMEGSKQLRALWERGRPAGWSRRPRRVIDSDR